jgi:Transposase IS116/IS110/IS902 family
MALALDAGNWAKCSRPRAIGVATCQTVPVVPFIRDSGKMHSTRAICDSRAQVRAVLYMCMLIAPRRNPVLRAFYTTCMRKLLIMLNAVIRHQTTWNPELGAIPSDLPSPFSTARGSAVITADTVGTD